MNVNIIDYGTGNHQSLVNFLKSFELFDISVSNEKKNINKSKVLILPGVGNFGQAIQFLKKKKILNYLISKIKSGHPTLGICLGFQILFYRSDENLEFNGMKIFKGFSKKLPFTNTGWKKTVFAKNEFGFLKRKTFYYNHSYFQKCPNKHIKAYTQIKKIKIPIVLKKDNLIGVQFHPENSQQNGRFFFKKILEFYEYN